MYTQLFAGIIALSFCFTLVRCNKQNASMPSPSEDSSIAEIPVAIDPPTASSIGFFLDAWQPKQFTAPSKYQMASVPVNAAVRIKVDANDIITKIPPTLFGNNANLYMSQMIDQPVLINHIKNINPGLLRYPGGNISSLFFWNASPHKIPSDIPEQLLDGSTGDKIKSGYWFGKNEDGWTLSVDNYYRMLEQTQAKGVITINYGYARYGTSSDPVSQAAHLAADWVRYDRGRTQYWEIGNESNGAWQAGHRIDISQNKDGQPEIISGVLYGNHFKIFADSMRKAAREIGATIYIGAQLLEQPAANWANATDKTWNEGVINSTNNSADYYIVHSYYTPYNRNSTVSEILATPTKVTYDISSYMKQSFASYGAIEKPIALTEYNIFAVGSQQMVSHINGLHAVMVVGELMANKMGMACRWNLANAWEDGNDHGMFSQGEPASGEHKWKPRPVFYHLYYFQKMTGDRAVSSSVSNGNAIYSYASTFSSGELAVAIVNTSSIKQTIQFELENFKPGPRYYWYNITGGNDNGEFSRKAYINNEVAESLPANPYDYLDVPANVSNISGAPQLEIPARSVVFVVFEHKK